MEPNDVKYNEDGADTAAAASDYEAPAVESLFTEIFQLLNRIDGATQSLLAFCESVQTVVAEIGADPSLAALLPPGLAQRAMQAAGN